MSFEDSWGRGGNNGGARGGYNAGARGGYGQGQSYQQGRDGDSEYIRLSQQVKTNIFAITNNVGSLQKIVNFLGTQRDVPEMHHKMKELLDQTNELVHETAENIKQLGHLDGGSSNETRKRRMEQEKLSQDFKAVLQKFQACQKLAISKEKEIVQKQRASSFATPNNDYHDYNSSHYDEKQSLMDEENRRQAEMMDEQVDTQAAFIEEREEGIKALESTMLEVNDIFRDLSSIIHDQGQMLDNIESNITVASSHVESGTEQLGKASRYQKKARNKAMCLLVVVVVVAAILTLVLVMKLKK